MKRRNEHLALAGEYWKTALTRDSWAIDATVGNGRDLERILALNPAGIIGLDIQEIALEKARERIGDGTRVHLFRMSHASFPELAYQNPISLIVYNLGYLPGGDKTLTTMTETTLRSVCSGMDLIADAGIISITCYPGHDEGKREELGLMSFVSNLSPNTWDVTHHRWENRNRAPSLLIIKKIPSIVKNM